MLSNFAPTKQFRIDLAVHFSGLGKEFFSLKGNAGPFDFGNTVATPLNGHISIQEVSLAGVNHFCGRDTAAQDRFRCFR
jgi:hypothetical protein